MLDRATLATLALAAALLAPLSFLRLGAHEHAIAAREHEDVYYLPPPGWLGPMSLGHQEALADLIWMRALVYFGEEVVAQGGVTHVFDYAEAILALDPDFQPVYHWIATAGLYRPVAITPADVERTVAIMTRGLERFPDDGELAWMLGATLAFELPPLLDDPEAQQQARAAGADYLALAARLGAAPEWAVLSNATILIRLGRADAAVRHLEEMYASVRDESVRAEIEARIAQLRSESYARAFTDVSRDAELERLRDLPYVHPDLYFLIGPRGGGDWRATYRLGFAHGVLEDEALGALDEHE